MGEVHKLGEQLQLEERGRERERLERFGEGRTQDVLKGIDLKLET